MTRETSRRRLLCFVLLFCGSFSSSLAAEATSTPLRPLQPAHHSTAGMTSLLPLITSSLIRIIIFCSSSSSSNHSSGNHLGAALASQSGVNLVMSPLAPQLQSLSATSSPSVPRGNVPPQSNTSENANSSLGNGMKRELSSDGDESGSDLDVRY
jgi:hypothetical protein